MIRSAENVGVRLLEGIENLVMIFLLSVLVNNEILKFLFGENQRVTLFGFKT